MAKGDEIRGLLACHDGGCSGYAQYVTFFMITLHYKSNRFWLHANCAFCNGSAVGNGFAADINHMCLAVSIKMR